MLSLPPLPPSRSSPPRSDLLNFLVELLHQHHFLPPELQRGAPHCPLGPPKNLVAWLGRDIAHFIDQKKIVK